MSNKNGGLDRQRKLGVLAFQLRDLFRSPVRRLEKPLDVRAATRLVQDHVTK